MKHTNITVQSLEPRVLLTAYYLDTSFGDGGTATAHFRGASHFQASLVAEVDPQTVLVVGAVDSRLDNVPRRLVMAQFDAHTGQLKGQFGTGGMLTSIPVDRVDDAQRLPDGRLLVFAMKDWQPFVARFTPAGALDTSFGGDGIAELAAVGRFRGDEDRFFDGMRLRPAPDGKVVVLGGIGSSDRPGEQTLLARLTADGTLDKTFDGDGVVLFPDTADWLANIAVQPDGKVLMADAAELRRFTASGALDPGFGDGGIVALPNAYIFSLHLLPDGRLLSNYDLGHIARFTAEGQLDPTFGAGGRAALLPDMVDYAHRLNFFLDPDGTITAVNERGVSRFTEDGQPDPSFGIRGRINNPDHVFIATHVIPTSDGALFVTGYTNNNTPSTVLARLTEQTDPVFLEPGGRLVITGTAEADSITVDLSGDQLRVDLNGDVTTFPLADVTSIRLDTDLGDDVMAANVPMKDFDILTGAGNDAVTSIGGGNHKIDTGDGDDTIVTGDGNDTITAGEGDNSVSSGAGNDLISTGPGNDTIDAGAGDDRVFGGPGPNSLIGGDGDDYLEGGIHNDTLLGGAGNDKLHAGSGNNLVDGDDGDDLLKAGAGRDTFHGGSGSDRIYAGDGDNLVYAGDGDDYVKAGAGADTLWGEIGYDLMCAGSGDDYVNGGAGKDRLFGQQGDDVLYGGRNNDCIDGGPGSDLLKGLDGNDKLFAGDDAADTLDGGADDDFAVIDPALDLVLRIEAMP